MAEEIIARAEKIKEKKALKARADNNSQ